MYRELHGDEDRLTRAFRMSEVAVCCETSSSFRTGEMIADWNRHRNARSQAVLGLSLFSVLLAPVTSRAQSASVADWNIRGRAAALEQMALVAIEQGFRSVPPAAAQSISFSFDMENDSFVRNEDLGPFIFRAPETLGKGNIGVRLSVSQFELDETFGPTTHVRRNADDPEAVDFYTKFGSSLQAEVWLFSLSSTIGLSATTDVYVSLPVASVDTDARIQWTARFENTEPELSDQRLVLSRSLGGLERLFDPGDGGNPRARIRSDPYAAFGISVGEGVGLGRVLLGLKHAFFRSERVSAALIGDFLLGSPDADRLSGPSSPAIAPRIAIEAKPLQATRLHVDLGYEFDFEDARLRRLSWSVGPSFSFGLGRIDIGVGGSKYEEEIQWTPNVVAGENRGGGSRLDLVHVGDGGLGDLFWDVTIGAQLSVFDNYVVAASLLLPLNDDGARPDTLGTISVERYLY